jgi:hypothetical protein
MQTRPRPTRRRTLGLAAVAAGLALVALAAVRLAPAELGGGTAYVVVSDPSMEPALHPGDLVLVQRRKAYETGDVVAVESPQGLLPRRVIGIVDGLLVVKADAAEVADRAGVSPGSLAGEVVASIPAAGYALDRVRRPRTLAAIGLALGACSLSLLILAWPWRGGRSRRDAPAAGPSIVPPDPARAVAPGPAAPPVLLPDRGPCAGPLYAGSPTKGER